MIFNITHLWLYVSDKMMRWLAAASSAFTILIPYNAGYGYLTCFQLCAQGCVRVLVGLASLILPL